MTRPKFNKEIALKIFNKKNNPFKVGYCWHCGKKLVFKNRKSGLRGAWHIDHYPVVYRDIENQCCLGVTNPLDIKNLVPSCVNCNVSHKYEKSFKFFCGRSQCLCEKKCSFFVFLFIMNNILFYLLGYFSKYMIL